MIFISHRINTIQDLKNTPKSYGIEIDLRDYQDRLILQHDPFKDGENFEDFLLHYDHGTMILNIKSERIEYRVLELLKKYNIKEYFFLDSSFPMIYSLLNDGINNIAVRFSEFEGIDTIQNLKNKVKWIWVDCFTELPITADNYNALKKMGFKFCLVSPDLQGQKEKIYEYKKFLKDEGIIFDAICVKSRNIEKWL